MFFSEYKLFPFSELLPSNFTKQPMKMCSLDLLWFIGSLCSGKTFVFLCIEVKFSSNCNGQMNGSVVRKH